MARDLAFDGFDFDRFWNDDDYARKEYTDAPLTDAVLTRVEETLGYKLPNAYVVLARRHNGGTPIRDAHPMSTATSWAEDHVAVTGIYSIGDAKRCSLCGAFGSQFWIAEWGYPPIGVYFADCPSAGHDMFCLDYSECSPQGEPRVVHIDQECDYRVTHVADDFESFIRNLVPGDSLD